MVQTCQIHGDAHVLSVNNPGNIWLFARLCVSLQADRKQLKTTMKITKIKTKAGAFGVPVTTDLDTIVERMRSPRTKEAADRVAAIALRSRLAIAKGAARYLLLDSDRLPYLVFSATFGRDGFDKPNALTGLLMLNVPCPQGAGQIGELRRRVSQIPYTLLAFAGVSGVTLKVVVRCDLKDAKNIDKTISDSCGRLMRTRPGSTPRWRCATCSWESSRSRAAAG